MTPGTARMGMRMPSMTSSAVVPASALASKPCSQSVLFILLLLVQWSSMLSKESYSSAIYATDLCKKTYKLCETSTEAEFLNVIGIQALRVFLHVIRSNL